MLKVVRCFLNGMALGIAEIVPGVSGGTVAIILGFYRRLIESVNHFRENPKESLKFLTPLLLGMGTAILIFATLIDYLLTNYSLPLMLFFIGMIIGIIPLLFNKVKQPKEKLELRYILFVAVPLLFLMVVSHLESISFAAPEETVNNMSVALMFYIFVAGIIASAAMVIPGVSGSFVMLLLGLYPLVTYTISTLRLLLTDYHEALLFNILKVLGPLGIGIIIGLLSMMRLIESLLKKHAKMVYSIILGLVTGSVYLLFRSPTVYQSGTSVAAVIIGVITLLLGACVSFGLGRKKI